MVERGGLENRCGGNSTQGSNPCLSASCQGNMSTEMTEQQDYSHFIRAWRGRISAREKYLSDCRKQAYRQAEEAASILQKEYGIKRAFLFGSLLDKTRFTDRSDVDLAVEGLKKAAFFEAVGRLFQLGQFHIDLLPWEECKQSLKKEILLNGELIYESSR